MTKDQLQKELEEKVKPGVKPSDFKKLKRSKSADDIPATPSSVPVSRSKSTEPFKDPNYPYTALVSQQEELDRLQKEIELLQKQSEDSAKQSKAKSDTIALLRKKIEDLEKTTPPHQLLQDQLQQKQSQIENLRQQLETKPALTELDQSLFARHKNLKDWFTQYSKNKKLDQELSENIAEASTELINQDQLISQLRSQISNLKLTNQSLTKDLNLATKLAELRRVPLPINSPNLDYLKYGIYALATITFIWLLRNN